jgi:cullin-associated NEDD8-dissociated protein 1
MAIGEQGVGRPIMERFLQEIGVTGDPAIVGKSIGTLLVSGGTSVRVKLEDFARELQSSQDEQRKCLALSVLGEAGLRLGSSSPLQPDLFTTHFGSKSNQVALAAAIALGRAGAGNINAYLPVILSTLDMTGSSQYLSLHSVKELLQHVGKARTDISSYTGQIWEKLLVASQGEDNKAVGAECIGRLAVIEPQTFLPLLQV